ncbi:hypothetical protein P6F26_05980 [Roseibacterium sp. SDUM158017]|uniref:hypothetical protein n=1 Tax=Roseicyclus salinarum TaxID=3036773 RepID=UPI0024152420|nr:hypothetical protein [Roseibacterium sp. SDUM158017]MDG4647986.1 hypothetical protein [Roseibacterium sp. SDUM158017]
MDAPLALSATHSHLFPGARGHAEAPLRDGPVTLAFADGTRVAGWLRGGRLGLEAHETAKGAKMPAKCWSVEAGPPGPDGRVPFRVAARA